MSSSSSESSTSESLVIDATYVGQYDLPATSRQKYLKTYNNFVAWKKEKGATSFSENVFLSYFQELSKTKQPSTLWSTYSMLKSTVNTNNDIKIETYTKLSQFLKKQGAGFKSKKSRVLTSQDVEKFLEEAPDEIYLVLKASLILGIHGACRGNELLNLTVDDIEKHSDQLMLVKLIDAKTKKDKSFIIRDHYKSILEKYMALRPFDMDTKRFLIRYQNGRCMKQVIGKNKIASMPREIAAYLKLPEPQLYTGHCFRRTAATFKSGFPMAMSVLTRKRRKSTTEEHKEVPINYKPTKISDDVIENIKEEADPLILPVSPFPSTSKHCEEPSSSFEDISKQPDIDVIPDTQTGHKITTTSGPNKTITITLENCPNISNVIIKF